LFNEARRVRGQTAILSFAATPPHPNPLPALGERELTSDTNVRRLCLVALLKVRVMTIEATSHPAIARENAAAPIIHPRWVRVTHWVNALAMFMMIGSGWQIYDASPLFNFIYFPREIALGEWLAGALLWHFAAMWLLVINGVVYLTLGIVTGRFRRKLLPIRPRDVVHDALAALRGKLSHDDLSVYNAVQRLLYAGVILAGVVIVLSGLSIWKPVQLKYLTAFFGGYDIARYVHFSAMASIVAFLTIHIVLALLVPKSLRAMIVGR
jgi:thiosulfate reductase cytochrome b subunit